jgi:hypothetical protein
MKHILYRTTCALTGCYYIGIHSTINVDDGYLGSGKRLRDSIKKHGRHNHQRTILREAKGREELLDLEEQTITKDVLNDPKCLNLSIGGRAGIPGLKSQTKSDRLKTVWANEEHRSKMSTVNAENARSGWSKPGSREKRIASTSVSSTKMWQSEDLRKAMSERMRLCTGEKSSQFGTCWVVKDGTAKKIKKELLDQYLAEGFARGRKSNVVKNKDNS